MTTFGHSILLALKSAFERARDLFLRLFPDERPTEDDDFEYSDHGVFTDPLEPAETLQMEADWGAETTQR